jgi:hypothetical protein
MKKIRPVQDYIAQRYPSVIDSELDHVSRRGFLCAALSTSAAAGALLVAGPGTVLAGGRRARTYKTQVNVGNRYTFRYGNYELQRIAVQTKSERLVRFLEDKKEASHVIQAVRKVLDAHNCADLSNGGKLARLQRRVGQALRAVYRKHTKRWVAAPTVVLFVYVPSYRHCRGKCRPATPYCSVPQKRPRPRR